MSQPVLFARVRPIVHDELREVAELAGMSMARVADILLADILGLTPSAGRDAVRRIVNQRKKGRIQR